MEDEIRCSGRKFSQIDGRLTQKSGNFFVLENRQKQLKTISKTTQTISKIACFRVKNAYLERNFTPIEGKVTQLRGKVTYYGEWMRMTKNYRK